MENLQINNPFSNNLTINNRITLKIVANLFILHIFEHIKTTMRNNNNNNFNNPNL